MHLRFARLSIEVDTHHCFATYFLLVWLTQIGACGGGDKSSSPTPVIHSEPINDTVDGDPLVIDSVDGEPMQDGCTNSAPGECGQQPVSKVSLIWDIPTEAVDGYLIYIGGTAESIETPIGNFPYGELALVESGLTVTIDLAGAAPLATSESACFRLRSYNAYGQSDFSSPACLSLLPSSPSAAPTILFPG